MLKISKNEFINPTHVSSVERKGELKSLITMESGIQHVADFPLEIMVKRIQDASSGIKEILKNIDLNTQSVKL